VTESSSILYVCLVIGTDRNPRPGAVPQGASACGRAAARVLPRQLRSVPGELLGGNFPTSHSLQNEQFGGSCAMCAQIYTRDTLRVTQGGYTSTGPRESRRGRLVGTGSTSTRLSTLWHGAEVVVDARPRLDVSETKSSGAAHTAWMAFDGIACTERLPAPKHSRLRLQ
jgi:hypothetical protein